MTDAELIDRLSALSEDEKLTDEESDLLVAAAGIIAKKEIRKLELVQDIRAILHRSHGL